MITFEKVRFKNFFSFGNNWTEVDLNHGRILLIEGKNGNGKSTLIDAILFALFGRPLKKVTKSQIPNSINKKDCVVEIEFHTRGRHFKITRGLNPSKLEVFIDGKKRNNEARSQVVQRFIEDGILMMNHSSFSQIIALGASSFLPFMQLPVHLRRSIIEDLLDINELSQIQQRMKNEASSLKGEIDSNEFEKKRLESEIELRKKVNDSKIIERKLDDLIIERDDLKKKIEKLESKELFLKKKIEDHENEMKLIDKLKRKISICQREREFIINNDVCSQCGQEINDDVKNTHLNEIEMNLEKLKKELKEKEEEFDESVKGKVERALFHLRTLQVKKNHIDDVILRVQNELKQSQKMNSDEIGKLNDQLKEISLKISKQKRLFSHFQFCLSLLKDDGIRSVIIERNLKFINFHVNKFLEMMEFPVQFHLNGEFKEEIRARGKEGFCYFSFSEGEKKRIDLALLFTWRELAKRRNSVSSNLLIIDEVFDGSLDKDGIDGFKKILNSTHGDGSVFIISHNDKMKSLVDCVISVEKRFGFSHFKDERICE